MVLVQYTYDASGQYLLVNENGIRKTWKLEIDADHPDGRWRNVSSGRYANRHETNTLDTLYDNRP